ncbi:methionine ABC transporter permease [Micromonospora sagamiensis]|uniref:D-methionine transport system permease protein n=2 Tax=Micromonospora sagamiensis TaxID=47875 RepID=A0A562WGV6_9ACTN|nr:methionine ABC transporter permease [Micromonospora sagamiensis]TWJ29549.1 D-methionine transport system permease protein [Micromonospora sagamiensis]BCL17422.1 ABC transporter permease [Micromonospora sagamiensis]
MIAPDLVDLLRQGLAETAYMVGVATLLSGIGGLLVGVLLVLTERGNLLSAPAVNALLGLVVNVGRSLPFIILLVAIIPFTRAVTGTTIGTSAAIVPLTVSAIPFYARIVEASIREVGRDVVNAARAMGASRWQIIVKVLLREARPGLVAGLTITVVALIGYSAMAGVVGGGGLGDLALRYGYQRFEDDVMVGTVVLLIVVVQAVQMLGDRIARHLSHR